MLWLFAVASAGSSSWYYIVLLLLLLLLLLGMGLWRSSLLCYFLFPHYPSVRVLFFVTRSFVSQHCQKCCWCFFFFLNFQRSLTPILIRTYLSTFFFFVELFSIRLTRQTRLRTELWNGDSNVVCSFKRTTCSFRKWPWHGGFHIGITTTKLGLN